jgi:hypothetical protein
VWPRLSPGLGHAIVRAKRRHASSWSVGEDWRSTTHLPFVRLRVPPPTRDCSRRLPSRLSPGGSVDWVRRDRRVERAVSQSQRVNEHLRDEIVAWELQPSPHFNEVEWAERVNVWGLLGVRQGVYGAPRGWPSWPAPVGKRCARAGGGADPRCCAAWLYSTSSPIPRGRCRLRAPARALPPTGARRND